MRYLLFASGENTFEKINYKLNDDDIFIAIDGGLKTLKENKLPVDIFFGDNDSYLSSVDDSIKEKYFYKMEKDYSDLELALMYLQNIKAKEEIIIFNATGKRLDHFFATLELLLNYQELNIKIIDDLNEIYLLKESKEIKKTCYQYISIFNPYKDTVISLKGFKYELNNYKLKEFCNLGLSNEIKSDNAFIKTTKPLLIIESKDK